MLIQHLIWHEGYHQGQIKLTLKLVGHPLVDHDIGPRTWGLWRDKTDRSSNLFREAVEVQESSD